MVFEFWKFCVCGSLIKIDLISYYYDLIYGGIECLFMLVIVCRFGSEIDLGNI